MTLLPCMVSLHRDRRSAWPARTRRLRFLRGHEVQGGRSAPGLCRAPRTADAESGICARTMEGLRCLLMPPFKTSVRVQPTGDQPQAIAAFREPALRGSVPVPARRHRHRQDGDDGLDHRGAAAPGARDRAQQDARRAALQRVPRVLPRERGRVLRLLLRLLPARGVRPAGRSLHREGLVPERRHRPAPPLGDVEPALAQGRRHRRVGLGDLRPRLARGVREARRHAARRRGAGPRPRPPQARRHPLRAQRHAARAREVSRQGRRDRDPAGARGVRVPDLDVRRRDRADHATSTR